MEAMNISMNIQARPARSDSVDTAWVGVAMRLLGADREFVKRALEWAESVSKLPKRQLEQVNWVLGINKFYERMVSPTGGVATMSPSMMAITSGRQAQALVDHVADIARWMDFRERHGGSGEKMTYEQCLDRIDKISGWCAKNGVGRLAMPIRQMIAKCKDYISVMRKVQEVA